MTYQEAPEQQKQADESDGGNGNAARVLLWVGVAGLSAAIAFTIVRAAMKRRPGDETSQRIQLLIDEANHLLKTLDDQRTG